MKNTTNDLWLIGTGLMAVEYAKVLKAQGIDFTVIGRGQERATAFSEEFGVVAHKGGLAEFLSKKPTLPQKVIVAVGIEALTETTLLLLNYGVKDILLEKPGIGYPKEIKTIINNLPADANVVLAYNRRFYSAVRKARELIMADGGVKSYFFEFTEWSHTIKDLVKDPAEHENWFLGNSTHVIDTAFFLGGKPVEISAYHTGSLDWHPASSIFVGAGVSESKALFSYTANWAAPGRWVVEMMTSKHRFIMKPMEKLFVQEIGSVQIAPVELTHENLDIDYKPGIYLQTQAFLASDYTDFCTIQEQFELMETYMKMSGYSYS